ncbi:podocalyxin [Dromiciops gliroides]|uniref:podocalyxin n=1 Tax=Dromiciops gliroides TaxID=33562 RepID=UPI001CC5E81D|nr:podocalyxin [Dromiciops gliroides]
MCLRVVDLGVLCTMFKMVYGSEESASVGAYNLAGTEELAKKDHPSRAHAQESRSFRRLVQRVLTTCALATGSSQTHVYSSKGLGPASPLLTNLQHTVAAPLSLREGAPKLPRSLSLPLSLPSQILSSRPGRSFLLLLIVPNRSARPAPPPPPLPRPQHWPARLRYGGSQFPQAARRLQAQLPDCAAHPAPALRQQQQQQEEEEEQEQEQRRAEPLSSRGEPDARHPAAGIQSSRAPHRAAARRRAGDSQSGARTALSGSETGASPSSTTPAATCSGGPGCEDRMRSAPLPPLLLVLLLLLPSGLGNDGAASMEGIIDAAAPAADPDAAPDADPAATPAADPAAAPAAVPATADPAAAPADPTVADPTAALNPAAVPATDPAAAPADPAAANPAAAPTAANPAADPAAAPDATPAAAPNATAAPTAANPAAVPADPAAAPDAAPAAGPAAATTTVSAGGSQNANTETRKSQQIQPSLATTPEVSSFPKSQPKDKEGGSTTTQSTAAPPTLTTAALQPTKNTTSVTPTTDPRASANLTLPSEVIKTSPSPSAITKKSEATSLPDASLQQTTSNFTTYPQDSGSSPSLTSHNTSTPVPGNFSSVIPPETRLTPKTQPTVVTSESTASVIPGVVSRESTSAVYENSTLSPTSPYSSHHQPPAMTTSGSEIFSPIPNKITCLADSYTTENLLVLKMTNFSICDGVKDSRNHSLYMALCRAGKANFNKDRDLCHVQLVPQPEKQEVAVVKVTLQTHLQPKELYEVLKKRWDDLKKLGVSNMTYGKESLDKEVEDRFSMPLIITIVCMAAFLLLVAAIYGCFHQRFTQRKDQQRLTEELQTVENGYHDNPTLEVMETSSEMQEKKVANLNGELGDSWIVPLDNLTKDDLDQEEEDTHL